jgi:hypothetical protein
MLKGLWTIGVKVPDLERELQFHRDIGNEIVLDEVLELDGKKYRIPLIKMGDKYMHLAEKMVYENLLDSELPYGYTHLVYVATDFEVDVKKALDSGARQLHEPVQVRAGFGERRVAFMQSPSGWIFEYIDIIENLVPDVV